MSGPNSPNLSPLDYQVWGQCWSLVTSQVAAEAKNALQLIWSALLEEAIDNAVKDHHK